MEIVECPICGRYAKKDVYSDNFSTPIYDKDENICVKYDDNFHVYYHTERTRKLDSITQKIKESEREK